MSNAGERAVPDMLIGDRDDELAALVVLMSARAMAMERLAAEAEVFGSAVVILNRVRQESILAPKFGAAEIQRARKTVAAWRAAGRDVRPVFDRSYPLNLRDIFNKPPLIFIKGTWREDRDGLAVAVVGTRKPSAEGARQAKIAATRLVESGITVVSGLAAGIDMAAHTAALDAGGRTVAVMGTGIDRVYPSENAGLASRIVSSGGALVSQFFPDHPPTKSSFPLRNVVMSGLSLATFVIEAGETSGARQQTRNALYHGRAVFLLSSLVERYAWAKRFVDEGVDGVKAVKVDSVEDVIERFVGMTYDVPAVAAI